MNNKEIVKCSVEHCDNKAKTRGYCGKHYQSLNKYGDPLYTEKKGTSREVKYKPLPYEETHKNIEGIEHKLCRICEVFKPMNEEHFYKKKTSLADGFDTYCKECLKKKSLQWQYDNYDQWKTIVAKRDATPEKKMKTREAAKKQRERGDYKKWLNENKDKTKLYQEKRKQNKTHEISKQEWIDCKNYFNNCCAYCGLPEEDHYIIWGGKLKKSDLHREHVDHEGANDLSNCVPACRDCNGKKWTFELFEWYNEENPDYTVERLDKINQWLDEDYKQYITEKKPKRPYVRKNLVKNT